MIFIASEIFRALHNDHVIRANVWLANIPVKTFTFLSWDDVNKHLSENTYCKVIFKLT